MIGEDFRQRAAAKMILGVEDQHFLTDSKTAQRRVGHRIPIVAAEVPIRPVLDEMSIALECPDLIDAAGAMIAR